MEAKQRLMAIFIRTLGEQAAIPKRSNGGHEPYLRKNRVFISLTPTTNAI
jgi:hypothetical protein